MAQTVYPALIQVARCVMGATPPSALVVMEATILIVEFAHHVELCLVVRGAYRGVHAWGVIQGTICMVEDVCCVVDRFQGAKFAQMGLLVTLAIMAMCY